uniref:NudC domain-containing protein 3 n=1 Tax=Neogobius melanostomus TaxID=47308 RepID=A0A8C6TTT2_9GOBI
MASPLEMSEMYDNALLGILQHVGNIQDFLQVYFGFLYRKTDFYRLLSSPNDKMGFPPGVAEKMVLKAYKVFEKVAEHERERRLNELQIRKESSSVPAAIQEFELSSDSQAKYPPPREETQSDTLDLKEDTPAAPAPDALPSCSATELFAQGDQAAAGGPANQTEKGHSDPDSYNGAVTETYSWSQDYTDVEVRVFVPKTIVKGKQVTVNLQSSAVQVTVKEGAQQKTLMEGQFTHKINTENSLWSLEPGKCVVMSLNKVSEVWWNAVLKGEQEIDINQINRERSMATVDEEEHAVLDRLTFDYHQKLQGKPQSHEMKVHEMLKKGWDAEGSPFKGQQFDPSMFDIPSSAVQF